MGFVWLSITGFYFSDLGEAKVMIAFYARVLWLQSNGTLVHLTLKSAVIKNLLWLRHLQFLRKQSPAITNRRFSGPRDILWNGNDEVNCMMKFTIFKIKRGISVVLPTHTSREFLLFAFSHKLTENARYDWAAEINKIDQWIMLT